MSLLKTPKVLIGVTTYEGKEYCRKEFVENVKRFTYPNYELFFVDNSKTDNYARKLRRDGLKVARVQRGINIRSAVRNSQNYLANKVANQDYDYLFMLESDEFPQSDIIERLLSHMDVNHFKLTDGRRVIGAPYFIGFGKHKQLVVAMPEEDKGLMKPGSKLIPRGQEHTFLGTGLRQVFSMGVGCTLIHASIFRYNLPHTNQPLRFWYSSLDDIRMADVKTRRFSDSYFYVDLMNSKIPAYCDSDILVDHRPMERTTAR